MLESITGVQNSGKTAYLVNELFTDFTKGRIIITNIHLNFPHIKVNKDWLIERSLKQDIIEWLKLNNIPFKKGGLSFGFDELWIWLDARQSMANTIATYFFLQSSKDDSNIRFTAQTNNQNDRRIRDNLHRITECDRVLKYNDTYFLIDNEERYLSPELNLFLYIQAEIFKRQERGGLTTFESYATKYIKAMPLFELFDTSIKIAPVLKKELKYK